MFKTVSVILLFYYFMCINGYINLNLRLPTTKYGFVYPHKADPNRNVTYVLEGVDVLVHLAKVPDNYTTCKIVTPDTEFTHVLTPDASDSKERIVFWSPNYSSKECGARIKNVNIKDTGRWRLQAIAADGDYKIQSFLNLQVIKNFERPNGNFVVRQGEEGEFNVTDYANYCEITEPSNLPMEHKIFDHCYVDIESVSRQIGGKWKVNVGIYGKIDEITLQPSVTVLEENFEVGNSKSGSKINLFCNLRNTVNTTFAFCRFVKDGQDVGFRLNEGLSNGKYSYYGNNFKDGDCGMTIEKPEQNDYVTWKCTIGFYRNGTDNYEIKEAIIPLSKNKKSRNRSRRFLKESKDDEEKNEQILAAINHPLTLFHKADFIIKYCIFTHPNGTIFAVNKPFFNANWTTVGNLETGQCGMKIFKTSKNESGTWHYQIGYKGDNNGMDYIGTYNVIVSDYALVGVERNLKTTFGQSLTVKCKAVTIGREIEYCRFTLPNGDGFQIREENNKTNPIDGNYIYEGTSLKDGDCQVTVQEVREIHIGRWLCGARIYDSPHNEDFDYIYVDTQQGLTIASISGIVVGAAIGVVALTGCFIMCRRRNRDRQSQRRQTYLSQSSHSSSEVTQFQRADPLVPIEEEIRPVEQERRSEISVHEEIVDPVGSIGRPSTRASTRPSAGGSHHSDLEGIEMGSIGRASARTATSVTDTAM